MQKREEKNYSWIAWTFGIIAASYLCNSSGGSSPTYSEYPNAPLFEDEYIDDMQEIDPRMLTAEYDPCIRYGACDDLIEPDDSYYEDFPDQELLPPSGNTVSSCPNGCAYYVNGCDIKGNISFESGEKIYHVPGQKYYISTSIDPSYGEKWFCTESEARANGWRKSFE